MANTNAKLPKLVNNRILRGVEYNNAERDEIYDKFMNKFFNLLSEEGENLKKSYIFLEKVLGKKKHLGNPNVSKKLTYHKRRELGLYTLGKKSLKYKDLLPLHELWKEYMTKYLNLNELRAQNWKNSPVDPNFETISQKLFRADYHGSEMTVVRSKCYSLVGKSGIVAMETKNSFKLLGNDDLLRTIPKSSCAFTFTLDEFKFNFFGRNLQVRPAERSIKKLKTTYINDL